jgi:putative transposase
MLKTFKYRFYPSKAQRKTLERHLEICRLVYNKTLEIRKDSWEQDKKSVSLYDTNNMLPQWKEFVPDIKQVYSQVLQNVQLRVDLAFKAFFRRCKTGENPGYPRFKGFGRYDSITYPQFNKGVSLDGNILKLGKIGSLKFVLHRSIEGKVKSVTIRRTPTRKWFVSFACEIETQPFPVKTNAVGIDVGLKTFAVLSDGKKIANPRFFKQEEKSLAKAQHKLSKQAKGSAERRKARRIVARVHERITNKRSDFIFQTANKLVKQYGIIAIEDLKIQNMMQESLFAKSIADVAWRQFANQLVFKAEYAGRQVVRVNPKNTSKRCSRCGTLVEKDLSVRVHHCPVCQLKIDRDLNASINILALGLKSMGSTPRSPAIYRGE